MEHRKRTADEMSSPENIRSIKPRQESAFPPERSSHGHTVTAEQRQSREMDVDEPLDPIAIYEPTTSTVPTNPPTTLAEGNTPWAVPDEPASEMVQDDISDEEHARLDKLHKGDSFSNFAILSTVKSDISDTMIMAFQEVVRSCPLMDRKYDRSFSEGITNMTQLVSENLWLSSLLEKCSKLGSAREIRCLKILRPPESPKAADTYRGREIVVEESWECDYRGDAAQVLLMTISDYLAMGEHRKFVGDWKISHGTTGFPPPDDVLRDWLLEDPRSQENAERKLDGFMCSLLKVTLERLRAIEALQGVRDLPETSGQTRSVNDLLAGSYVPPAALKGKVTAFLIERQGRLASAFRDSMTKKQKFGRVNDYRRTFFEDVIKGANSFLTNCSFVDQDQVQGNKVPHEKREATPVSHTLSTGGSSPVRYQDSSKSEGIKTVVEAGRELASFISPANLLSNEKPTSPQRPLVILMFDECHQLSETKEDCQWSIFSELRRVLRQVKYFPIFSLFLTTAGKFHLLSSETSLDLSRRISDFSLISLPPITETGYDVFMYPAVEGKITLKRVASDDWICHLGRPLFGSLYDSAKNSGERVNIHHLAERKLLGGSTMPGTRGAQPSQDQSFQTECVLACLAVRFALEFRPTTRDDRALERRQIERHMRLCVAATSGFEELITTAGSEPLLAEAAYNNLLATRTSPARHLASRLDVSYIDYGQRGELIAMLILMEARDRAASKFNGREVPLGSFLEALLPGSLHQQLHRLRPRRFRAGEDKSFHKSLKDSKVWFNHVIKVQDYEMIKAHSFWEFITRGAMILCPNCQRGVDIIIPFCYTGDIISRDTVSTILIQVKNDVTFGVKPKSHLFDSMDPFSLHLLSDDETPLPVVRMVFALASEGSAVHLEPPPECRHHNDAYTAYDIWFAGVSPGTFPAVGNDEAQYKVLLGRCLPLKQALSAALCRDNETNEARETLRRAFDPLSMSSSAHRAKYVSAIRPSGDQGNTEATTSPGQVG
ncbi:hypothetical protein BC834DRAFT_1044451 [Gloeopeniophorella convolvens]|nr:hypothetical protein BC834DRAFT_1044451 [Gloeopeniophorella convolvens]